MSVKPTLVNKPLPRLRHLWFDKEKFRNGFDAIRERDVLLYYPYHTFEHVLELLRQASFDPSVLAIKINIYRVAKDSRIIDSMIHAAHNGKKSPWWWSCRRASMKRRIFTGPSG